MTIRNLKGIDTDQLRSDLRAIRTDDIKLYNNQLKTLVDKHAPLMTRGMSARPYASWYNIHVKSAECECRRAERQWLKTGLTIHEECFLILKQQFALKTAKKNYYMSKFRRSYKQLFGTCDELLGRSKQSSLPSIYEDSALPNMVVVYSSEKVQNPQRQPRWYRHLSKSPWTWTWWINPFSFDPVSEKYVKSIILKAPIKSCDLDPIPTSLFSKCVDDLIPSVN